ncbi:MAG: ferredoxin [Verrucomicrobia bacterium]|nr:MAG: ferredoxin [Verrucomicrobiota bacterium]PYJ95237.1 MAG: ferredoxin [Verrucomicrobiota bacterium]PYK32895.1 MAG: ferredoxin [Verrucomicrobiota bacterium]PYL18734.1 MAG: ferredoxin [Verrucomicrobiota bacterium]
MPHVVTDKCNGCKFTDCVEVCPVACFYEMDNQVVIHPEDCIDCMACVEVCPVHAIYADADLPPEFTKDIEFNANQAHQIKDSGAEAITTRKDPLPGAMERKKALGY